jgi:hypothetical protein
VPSAGGRVDYLPQTGVDFAHPGRRFRAVGPFPHCIEPCLVETWSKDPEATVLDGHDRILQPGEEAVTDCSTAVTGARVGRHPTQARGDLLIIGLNRHTRVPGDDAVRRHAGQAS